MRQIVKNVFLGVLAGAAIALGGFLNIICKAYLNEVAAKWIGALVFPIGLTLVCFLSLNLFTGKIGYLFDKKKGYPLFLLEVYIGNILGAVLIGAISYMFLRNTPSIFNVAQSIMENKANSVSTTGGAFIALAYSTLCGMLVYIAVEFYKKFKRLPFKILGIFIPIALFVYLGFDHCVANMYYFSFASGYGNIHTYFNIAIATIGNSIGAIALNELIKLIKKFKASKKDKEKVGK